MRAIEKTRRCVAGWAACLVAIATVAGGARAQDPDAVPGRIEGTGTHFEVTDSEWKNVTLDSTEVIDLRLLSAPAIIEMGVGAAAGATSAELTLSGLDPTTTYYKYEDDWHGLQQVTTDAAGALLFTQDLSQWHRVSIVTVPSTVFLGENGWTVGGLPWSYGTWDPVTRTATLTATPPQGHLPLQIDIDNVTLDGQGVVLTKSNVGSREAILVSDRTGVTIRNVVIASTREFGSGVRLVRCEACVVEDCDVTVNARYAKGVVVQDSNDCVVRNNSLSSPQPSGYAVHLNRYQKKGTTSARNTISGNAIQNSRNGILLDSGAPGTTDNVVTGNTLTGIGYGWGIGVRYPTTGSIVSGNTVSNFKEGVVVTSNGMLWDAVTVEDNVVTGNYLGLRLQSTIGNLVTRNTLSSNSVGLDAYNSHNNQVYRNNFLKNGTQATVYGMSSGNVFSLELPVGGNHWSNWTKPDLDADGFVDAPYLFNSGQQDALPWVVADAWANQPPVTVLTADKTKAHPGDTVTFDGSGSSDPDGDPLTYQWTLAAPMGSNAKLVPVTMDSSKVQLQVDAWGSYVVSLLVIDDSGAGGAQVSLMVGMVNLPPVPVADDQLAHPGNIVMLDGSASWDPEMDYPLTYNWFLSGPAGSMAVMNDATSQTAWFVPDVWGDYNVRLYVTDSLGEKGGPRNVLVSMTNTAPVAFAGDDQAIIQLGTLVHLDGTESYDDDGDSISYWWMLGSAPMGSMERRARGGRRCEPGRGGG
jgi:parallel beta-helix repeat protein